MSANCFFAFTDAGIEVSLDFFDPAGTLIGRKALYTTFVHYDRLRHLVGGFAGSALAGFRSFRAKAPGGSTGKW